MVLRPPVEADQFDPAMLFTSVSPVKRRLPRSPSHVSEARARTAALTIRDASAPLPLFG
jgi:hypothetical protein